MNMPTVSGQSTSKLATPEKASVTNSVYGPKLVQIRVFEPENKTSKVRRIHAPAGRHFTQEGVDKILELYVNDIERLMPNHEYRMVQVSENSYNFVWHSYRQMQVEDAA